MPIQPLPPASTQLYKKAPAVEVMYNIRVALPEPVDVTKFLKAIKADLPNEFATHLEVKSMKGEVTVKTDGSADSDIHLDPIGYRCTSPDGTFVAHYLQQGLVLNFLPPYAGYAVAIERLRAHWEVYRKVVGDVPMAALSLRYIDRIDIPKTETTLDLDEYFKIVSKIPDGLTAHHCYQQYWFNDPGSDIRARMIWSSLDNLPGHFSFALDTEAMLDPANIMEPAEAWVRFDDLHAWCWHVFNHSLTDKCKQLFH